MQVDTLQEFILLARFQSVRVDILDGQNQSDFNQLAKNEHRYINIYIYIYCIYKSPETLKVKPVLINKTNEQTGVCCVFSHFVTNYASCH